MLFEPLTYSMLELIIDESNKLIKRKIKNKRKTIKTVAVAMFDLPGSTQIKLMEGHTIGTQRAIKHNLICEKISKKFGGNVIKYMGDGIFIEFDDPIKACEAALEIKKAIHENPEFTTKGGITIGVVETIEIIEGIKDLMGSTVDRCARIASFASKNQILIDQTLLDATESFLRDNDNIIISEPMKRSAKGIGKLNVFELSLKPLGFSGYNIISLNIIEEGRMPLGEKMDYLMSAKKEIIELGIGLTSFSDDFSRARTTEFKDKIVTILKKGIKIKCLVLDPNSEAAKIYVNYNNESKYLDKMKESLNELIRLKKEFLEEGLINFNILIYNDLPHFHASCVDLEESYGKISISHYLPKIPRAENPITQFSRESNPCLYEKYNQVIKKILENSKEYFTET